MKYKNTLLSLLASLCFIISSYSQDHRALIIEGSASTHQGSFMAFKRNLKDWSFQTKTFISDDSFGTGLELNINELELDAFDVVLMSIHQGTLSSNLIEQIVNYIHSGGKFYIVYQSFPKYYFADNMSDNTNELLSLLGFEDKVVYGHDSDEATNMGSLIIVTDEERKIHSSRSFKKQMTKTRNTTLSPCKAMMKPGHYFHRNSSLHNAKSIIEFNCLDKKRVCSVFWQNNNGGVLGIGTELHSSGASNSGVYNSWKLTLEELMDPKQKL